MAFFPLHDKNALRFIPFQRVTVGLIAINSLVFWLQTQLNAEQNMLLDMNGGVIPAALMGLAVRSTDVAVVPPEVALLSHMFLHGDIVHLLGNMVFLWVFGDNIEDAMGHIKFLIFYLLCGIAGAYLFAMSEPNSQAPLIGASGAISGIIGAYFVLYPRVRVWVWTFLGIPLRVPAYWAFIAWLAFQFYFIFSGTNEQTAWWAHLGGFAAGVVLIVFMKRRGVKLFGRGTAAEQQT